MPDTRTKIARFPANFRQTSCDDDREFAFEQYLNFYHHSFKSAYVPLRLVSGMNVRFDEAAGTGLFNTVLRGDYTKDKKAIAASLMCPCRTRSFIFGPPGPIDYTSALYFTNISCEYGLSTHACLNLTTICDASGDDVDKEGPLAGFTFLWAAYHKYREDTGLQRVNTRRCAVCNRKPERRSMLKKCAGNCILEEKPLYCSQKCQKADWPKHRQFCKIETVESDDECTTDSDVDEWEPNGQEEPPSYFEPLENLFSARSS